MSSDLPVRPGLNLPLEEVRLRTSRSSGPGGQHANVTASRVEASFDVDASATLSDAQKARVVELRYFGGLSMHEAAEVLEVSLMTVRRDWRVAKAWLYKAVRDAE